MNNDDDNGKDSGTDDAVVHTGAFESRRARHAGEKQARDSKRTEQERSARRRLIKRILNREKRKPRLTIVD